MKIRLFLVTINNYLLFQVNKKNSQQLCTTDRWFSEPAQSVYNKKYWSRSKEGEGIRERGKIGFQIPWFGCFDIFVFSRRECEKYVKKFQGACFKKFSTNEEAENFVRGSDTGYNNNSSCTAFNVSIKEKPRKTVVYYNSTKLAKNKGLVIHHNLSDPCQVEMAMYSIHVRLHDCDMLSCMASL